MEDVPVIRGSSIDGKTLVDVRIPEKTGLIVLAIRKKSDDRWIFNPSSNEVLRAGDVMVVLGTEEQVEVLRRL